MKIGEFELRDVEAGEGEHVADIIVLARVVAPDTDGRVGDYITVSMTKHTTGLIATGMVTAAHEQERDRWKFHPVDDPDNE
ncbi:hypothetical protein [Zhihengliuella halotolerans]|uniref:hypothetical protein n=1 Tax=Zhihengliuella halotolerans TaxID=370736 RepID=UPI000C800589|nr:hypothetical protein [Zhihengliuella halotolerans]